MPSSKTKKFPEELGVDFSVGFQKFSIAPIVKECLNAAEEDQRSWRFQIEIKSTDDIALAKEWILFEMFLLGQAILNYFKGNAIGERVISSLHEACASKLIEHNIFDSLDEFANLLKQRYGYYLEALKLAAPDNTLLLSKRLLEQISGGEGNPIYLPAIAKYYFDISLAYEKLVREVMEEVHLVA